jgi:hypothetical protein
MQTSDEQLLRFYAEGGADSEGRTFGEILAWSDARLEAVHNYIQWLFPLPERSGANPGAPLMTARVRAAFQGSAALQGRLREAWMRMLGFYGLRWEGGAVVRASSFSTRARVWLSPGNHNHLRWTRILRSLALAGLQAESAASLAVLRTIAEEQSAERVPAISPTTLAFWEGAGRELYASKVCAPSPQMDASVNTHPPDLLTSLKGAR